MKRIVRSLGLGFVLFGLIIIGILSMIPKPGPTSIELMNQAYDLDKRRQDDQATAASRKTAIDLWNIIPPVLLVLVVGGAVYTLVSDGQERRRRYEADENGHYPLPKLDARQLKDDRTFQLTALQYAGSMQATITRHTTPRLTRSEIYEETDRPALLAPPEAAQTLPDAVALADVLDTVPPGHLAYGLLSSGQLLTLPLGSSYHGLFHGDTRSGKTNAIDGMIVQLHHMSQRMPITLYAGDFKEELAATWDRSALFAAGVATQPAQIAEILEQLVYGPDGVKTRYQAFKQLGAETGRIIRNIGDYGRMTGQRPALVVMFVDEINAVLKAAGKNEQLASAMTQLLQMGAGAGIYLMGGAQYMSAQTLSREGSKQFVTRAAFGAYDGTTARMLFSSPVTNEDRLLLTGQSGRGLIRTVGESGARPFQALRCDEGDILTAIDLTRKGTTSRAEQAAESVSTLETSFSGFTAYETPETVSADTETTLEIESVIHRLKADGKGKKEIIKLLWGATPGGSKAYQDASKLYDQAVEKELVI
jgi:DNA segregation ATPase FtsK/SpoIIIE-like protein